MIGELRISLGALRRNARALQNLVGHGHAAFVVKSNAYGHGLTATGIAIEGFASRICVYAAEEALALREGGVNAPLLILGPVPPEMLDAAIAARAEIALWDTRNFLHDLAAAARRRSEPFGVHVKVNTGLNRFGLEPGEVADAVEDYARLSELRIAGIFSHLASAEEIDSPYTMQQLARFERAIAETAPLLERQGITPIRHIAASAAAMLWPQTRLDLARFGIALYGLWPSAATREAMGREALPLEPALALRSSLAVTRTIAAGEPVGYGNTYLAAAEMRIGVVPLGYADGVPRALSNRGAFVVDGARCPIVGRVAMNLTTIDITPAPHAQAGTAVVLIGRDGDACVTADDWAAWAETINYEIVARLPAHIPRRYDDD
ncbi:MAG TPA: alanine racemase [Candidatus Tyrphobacter sp.]